MISSIEEVTRGYSSAEARWARFGPYYAMFPLEFAFDVVNKFSKPGDYVIDPFAGRCSSIYAGGVLGRSSLGIEINPVGWLYGRVKLNPADKNSVTDRLLDVYQRRNEYQIEAELLPYFYRICFCEEVLLFLLSARDCLDWEHNGVDATLMSIILIYLHGKIGASLSNQMRMTKSMGMNYSIDWWTDKGLINPPEINPCDFLHKKIVWRYGKGTPQLAESAVVFGDSSVELNDLVRRANENDIKFSLLFTSPPYQSVTNYHADQWLRLWMLGDPATPVLKEEKNKGRFNNKQDYYNLLDSVFSQCAGVMHAQATVFVRTDKRDFTLKSTLEILQSHFIDYSIKIEDKPFLKKTQTELYGDKSKKPGEVDIIMTRR